MEIKLLYIQSGKEEWATIATDLYIKKINQYYKFKVDHIKTVNFPRNKKNEKIKVESNLIFKKITKDDFVVIFDESGKKFSSSVDFANNFQRVLNLNKRSIIFLIGGSYGFSEEIKNRADKKMSLSALTYNHHIAKVVALEQIYRAICIQKNIPYHNE